MRSLEDREARYYQAVGDKRFSVSTGETDGRTLSSSAREKILFIRNTIARKIRASSLIVSSSLTSDHSQPQLTADNIIYVSSRQLDWQQA